MLILICMEAAERNKKRKLELDWNKLLSKESADIEPPPPLVLINSEQRSPSRKSDAMSGGGGDDNQDKDGFWKTLSDVQLEESIQRQKQNLDSLSSILKDKGKKIRDTLELLEEEKKRRTLSRAKMLADECDELAESPSSGCSNGFEHQCKSHQDFSQSAFGASFCKKLEENTDSRSDNTFDKKISVLNRCEKQKARCKGEFSESERAKVRKSPRRKRHRSKPSFGDQKGRTAYESPSIVEKDAQGRQPNGSRRRQGKTVVIVDEDEPQLVKTTELEVQLPSCKKDAKISYPSRDAPDSVEISFGDIGSLAPETFLTSQIMNFYIQYLRHQAPPTNSPICDYHIFNTYFYPKLKEAVSYKGTDKDGSFIKFRRWWKGVNIFQKAYIFVPINEEYHWSLVIICIPDKEDVSGPIILHLDSLGFHSSRLVFKNIKSYMSEEWNYLNQGVAPSDLPIADKIWDNLPCSIDEKTIAVPQQKNDYDCGLFVLFFMERFMEEAPERLKKKDLAMFGKQWFRPEEASGLRVRIRNLLMEQFRNASEDTRGSQSSPSPSS